MRLSIQTLLLVTAFGVCGSASAAFVLVEDFDDVSDWSSTGSTANTLVANGGLGEFTVASQTSTSHYLGLGGNAIAQGSTGTVFYQVQNPAAGADLNHFVGFTVGNNPGAFSGYNGYIFNSLNGASFTGSSYNYQARDGGSGTATSEPLQAEELYNVWLVIDNAAKTYDVYINTGTGDAAVGDLAWSNLAFRTNTNPAGLAVDTFGIFGNEDLDTTVSYDNVYVDNGDVNLSFAPGADATPAIPEPVSSSLIGLGLGSLLLFRRRR